MSRFRDLVKKKFLFRFFLLKRLPMAYIAGIRVKELSEQRSITTIRYKWLTTNPFRSMYFACQAMAAEMATGLLLIDATYGADPSISMLIVKNESEYFKKVTGKVEFRCEAGNLISETIEKAKSSGEGVVVALTAVGIDEQGEKVSSFVFTWSLKVKSK
jgi:hypothetical protein